MTDWYAPNEIRLNKLSLTLEQGFKFLNTLRLRLKKKVMFLARESCQVAESIIITDTIEVVDYPARRQRLAVSFFPDKYVFLDISSCIRPVVIWFKYLNVSSMCIPTTFPVRIIFSFWEFPIFSSPNGPLCFHTTTLTPCASVCTWFTAVYTRVFMLFMPSSIFIHNAIISYWHSEDKALRTSLYNG